MHLCIMYTIYICTYDHDLLLNVKTPTFGKIPRLYETNTNIHIHVHILYTRKTHSVGEAVRTQAHSQMAGADANCTTDLEVIWQ